MQKYKFNVTEFVLKSQFDVMFHLFRSSIWTSTHPEKLTQGHTTW